jgi:hypothetical protein
VRYPWHALHGQTFDVERALTADGERVYVITLADGSLTHLPVWMTEDAAAGSTTLTGSPSVSVAGLEALRRLVDAVLDPFAGGVDAPGRR